MNKCTCLLRFYKNEMNETGQLMLEISQDDGLRSFVNKADLKTELYNYEDLGVDSILRLPGSETQYYKVTGIYTKLNAYSSAPDDDPNVIIIVKMDEI